jgi:ribonuclease Z
MTPLFHPHLVNDPFGDPALYVDFLFERRALLFDLGDLGALAARKLLRISHVFVSHTHMDHFAGFDRLLRLCLGRERELTLYGPPGFVDQVEHKLAAYTWNLVQNYPANFTIIAAELHTDLTLQRARFHCRQRFQRESLNPVPAADGVLLEDEGFLVRAVLLDHDIPCLGFALEEKLHMNVWKNRLQELGLPTGPWLKELKHLVRRQAPDNSALRVHWRDHRGEHERAFTVGQLRGDVLRIVPGQKIAYVVDVVYHAENARRITRLADKADTLFIESVFLNEDVERATARFHLTAHQAGTLARRAGVKHMVLLHFSPRYSDDPDALRHEAEAAFTDNRTQ